MKKEKKTPFGIFSYWEKKVPNDPLFAVKLIHKYNELCARKIEGVLPFLLEMNAKYPDAPDLLRWMGLEYQREHEYLKALQTFVKLIELYPDMEHYKKEFEACRAFLLSDSMPGNEETLQWLKKRLQEIWE